MGNQRNTQLQMQDYNKFNNNQNLPNNNNIISPISNNNFSSNNINKSYNNITYDNRNIEQNNHEVFPDDMKFQAKLREINPNLNIQFSHNYNTSNINPNFVNNKISNSKEDIAINNNPNFTNNRQINFESNNAINVQPSFNYQDEKKIEKEMEKKKKLEYQEELKRQIREKENKKKQDKQKIKEEDLKFEEKYGNFDYFNQMNPEKNQKTKQLIADEVYEHKVMGKKPNFHEVRKNNIQNNEDNKFVNERNNSNENANINNMNSNQSYINQISNQNNNYNSNSNYVKNIQNGLSKEYTEFKNNIISGNNPHITNNNNFDYAQAYEEIKYNNNLNNNKHQSFSNFSYPYTNNHINQSNNPYLMSQISPDHMNPFHAYNQSNKNIGMFTPNNFYPQQQQHFMLPSFFEEMMKMFFNQQMKIFQDYKETLDKLANERDNTKKENLLQQEKYTTLSKLKTHHEKLKSSVGFNPLVNNYNENLENMLQTIDKKFIPKDYDTDNNFYDNMNSNKNIKKTSNNYNQNNHLNKLNNDNNFDDDNENNQQAYKEDLINDDNNHNNYNNINYQSNNNIMNSDDRPLTGVKNQKLIYRNRYYAESINDRKLNRHNSQTYYEGNNNSNLMQNANIKHNLDEDYQDEASEQKDSNQINYDNLYDENHLNPLDLKYEDFRNKFEDLSQTQTYFNMNNIIDKNERGKLDNFNKSIASRNDLIIDAESKWVKIADKKHIPVDLMETWREEDLINTSNLANLDKDLDNSKLDKSKNLYNKLLEKEKLKKENMLLDCNNINKNIINENKEQEKNQNSQNNLTYKYINTELSSKNLVTEVHIKDKSIDNKLDNINKYSKNIYNQLSNNNILSNNNYKSNNDNRENKKSISDNSLQNQPIVYNSNKNTQSNYYVTNTEGYNIRSQRENINTKISAEDQNKSLNMNESQEEIYEEDQENRNCNQAEFEIVENDLKRRRIPERLMENFNTYNNLETERSNINSANDNINKNIYNINNSNLKNFNFNKTESYIDPNELQDQTQFLDKSNKNNNFGILIHNNNQKKPIYVKDNNIENSEESDEDQIRFKNNNQINNNNKRSKNNYHYQNTNLNNKEYNEENFEDESSVKDNYLQGSSNFNTAVKKDRNISVPIPYDKEKKERERKITNNQIQEKLQNVKYKNYNTSKNNKFNQSGKNNLSSKYDGDDNSNFIISDSNQTINNNYKNTNNKESNFNTNNDIDSENYYENNNTKKEDNYNICIHVNLCFS